MRFSAILIGYFVIGATMWGGGVIAWDDAGIGQVFLDTPGEGDLIDESFISTLRDTGGPLETAATAIGGALPALWNLLVLFIGYFFWPITVLLSVNAPTRIVVLLGGANVVAFLGGFLAVIRGTS